MIGEVKTGVVVYPEDKTLPTPYYYVEVTDTGDDAMVVAYKITDKQKVKFDKTGDYTYLQKPKTSVRKHHKLKFKDKTDLGKQLAQRVSEGWTDYVETLYAPACFVSEVTSNVDTLNDTLERGFSEYVPREIGQVIQDKKEKKVNLPDQEPTGVFIGFSHIHWFKDTIPPQGLTDYLDFLHDAYFNSEDDVGFETIG